MGQPTIKETLLGWHGSFIASARKEKKKFGELPPCGKGETEELLRIWSSLSEG